MCVGFLPTLKQFLSLAACSPSEHSLQRQNLSIRSLGAGTVDYPCVPGCAVVREPLPGENTLGRTGWGS